jgi:hypothetical protein
VDTGFIDVATGKWNGRVANDEQFNILQIDTGVANGANFLTPTTNADGTWPLDMTGYADLFIAVKPTSGGNYAMTAVMGPATTPFANLTPVNAAATLRGNANETSGASFDNVLADASESLTADVWNIFIIQERLRNQKLLQFKVTNNSGGSSDVETAFMRMV